MARDVALPGLTLVWIALQTAIIHYDDDTRDHNQCEHDERYDIHVFSPDQVDERMPDRSLSHPLDRKSEPPVSATQLTCTSRNDMALQTAGAL
jgi:hypothetical protein